LRAFLERPLEGDYVYLWLDAKVEKVRDGGRVRHNALVIAHGVHETGRREVLGLAVGAAETEAFWTEFIRSLVARGLTGVQLVISDAHPGLKAAIARVLGTPWQRCTVLRLDTEEAGPSSSGSSATRRASSNATARGGSPNGKLLIDWSDRRPSQP
jgi:transposase-like protein